MSDQQDKQRSESDAELEREIRQEHKFTLAEAIGRMAGPGAMKAESEFRACSRPRPRFRSILTGISWMRQACCQAFCSVR